MSYRWPGVIGWYANGPLGLEQGFTLPRRPARSGFLTLAVGRLSAGERGRLTEGGSTLAVLSRSGRRLWSYGDLSASDSRGRHVRAWIALAGSRVLLRVDDARARYPLTIDPLVQQAELGGNLGVDSAAVAISGSTVVVGVSGYPNGKGRVLVFTMPAGGWANSDQAAELTASDGQPGDQLGASVAISGNTIVAGAPSRGTAYVYTMPSGGWVNATQTAELTASDSAGDPAPGDNLGLSVAISGNTIVAGAPSHTINVGTPAHPVDHIDQGAAYVFTMPAGGWVNATQNAELISSDGGASDDFGSSVAISGDTIVAGGLLHAVDGHSQQGAGYVYTMPADGWGGNEYQTAELTASDGAPRDELGESVAISGRTVVAGAPSHPIGASTDQGAVYVYTMPAGGWVDTTQTAELTASDGGSGDALGWAVGLSGKTVVAGAYGHTVGTSAAEGAVYAYAMPAGGWFDATQTAELIASDGRAGLNLGAATAIDGSTIVANSVGPVYVFGGAVSCSLTSIERAPAGGHDTAEVTVTVPSGLESISNVYVDNASVSVQTFTPGTTAPVIVMATKATQGVLSHFSFDVTDTLGNVHLCV